MDPYNQWEQIPHPVHGYAYLKIGVDNCLIEISRGDSLIRAVKGTGDNYEIRDIKVESHKRRTGLGTLLFKDLVEFLDMDPPYSSIFGFTRVSNVGAQAFYQALGFDLTRVKGVYADGEAIIFSQEYTKLVEYFKNKEMK